VDAVLLGADTPLGLALQRLFVQWGRHRAEPVTLAACRFRSERQAKKAARRDKPQVVIDLRLPALIAAGQGLQGADIDRCHWLAKACEHSGMLYLLMSADRVFSGAVQRPLREVDAADASDETGLALIEAETRVRDAAPTACILRTGPLFSAGDDGWLSPLLEQLSRSRSLNLDDTALFCPSSASDVARVIAAVLDQCSVGADASGIFHYCSTDRTTHYGFAEVVLATAGQFTDLGDVTLHADSGGAESARVLDCSRLRDTFAIKQLPWRGQINEVVHSHYLQKKEAAAGAGPGRRDRAAAR
jgi:dTDP-4-dehydrorhamnose reductase